ncbi:MAG: hypothetical protein PUI16_10875 [Clostridia bacterium]|nr:hypothetical protein [Clostridia bacterium]MDY5554192.1 hypothetical protein [Blautia sp.]
MRIILYGTTAGCEKVRTYLDDFELHIYTHMEQLIPALIETIPDAVFILMENAAGMEGVIAVKKIAPELPVAWFSNDRDFAPQAYRLHTEYFASLPVNREKITDALSRCRLL